MNKAGWRASARYFDDLAPRWDNMMPLTDHARRTILETTRLLRISPGDTVLDAGCGTGVLFPFLLSAVKPGGRVIGLDVSPSMIETARRKTGDAALLLVAADIGAFLHERPDASFSAIACFQAFPHFEDKPDIIRSFFRVLSPGGRFAVLHVEGSAGLNAFHATLPPPVNAHVLPAADTLASQARSAGFTVIEALDGPGKYLVAGEKPGRPQTVAG